MPVRVEPDAGVAEVQAGRGLGGRSQGNYLFIGDLSAADVRQRAVAAAEMIGQPFGVMVAKVDGWSVMGLKRVPARQSRADWASPVRTTMRRIRQLQPIIARQRRHRLLGRSIRARLLSAARCSMPD